MAGPQSKGQCHYCGRAIAKGGMSRHFQACEKRKLATQEPISARTGKTHMMQLYHLQVEGTYAPMFWMHLEVPGDFTLGHLDQFLRDTWLECCGHMSAYRIGPTTYYSSTWEPGQKTMRPKLSDVLKPGLEFAHEYDFGTTTDLTLRVVGVRDGLADGGTLQIMARNDAPVWECQECGKPAVQICTECMWDEGGFLCKQHAAKHEHDEEMLLPVVNSPRMGMCGFTG